MLYRPVGPKEVELIEASDGVSFHRVCLDN
jgi:hypothetical protein